MFGGEQSVSHVTGRRWHGPADSVSTIWTLVSNVSSWPHGDVTALQRTAKQGNPVIRRYL